MSTIYTVGPVACSNEAPTGKHEFSGRVVLVGTPNDVGNYTSLQWKFEIYINRSAYISNFNYGSGVSVSVNINGSSVYSNSNYGNTVQRIQMNGHYEDDPLVLCSGTVNIPHNSDGTKSVSVSANITVAGSNYMGTIAPSRTVVLEPIARVGVISSAPNMTLAGSGTTNHTVQWTTESGFYYKVQYLYGSTILHTSSALATTATSYTWAVPYTIASNVTNAKTMPVLVAVHTYSDEECHNEIGVSSATFTVTFADSFKPSLSSATITQNNMLSGTVVSGRSNSTVAWTTAFNSGATLASASAVYIIGGTETGAIVTNTTGSPITLGTIPAFTDATKTCNIRITVKDSRGFSNTLTTSNFTAYGWVAPSITAMSAVRCDSQGEESLSGAYYKVTFTYSIRSLNNANAKSAKIYYRYYSSSTWTQSASGALDDYSGTLAMGPYALSAAQDEKLEIRVELSDSLSSTNPTMMSVTILPASIFLDIITNPDDETIHEGLGIGMINTKRFTIQSPWSLEVYGGKSISTYDEDGAAAGLYPNNGYGVMYAVVEFSEFSSDTLNVSDLFGTDIQAVVSVTQRGGSTGASYYYWTNDGTPDHFYITLKRTDGGTISSTTEFEILALPYVASLPVNTYYLSSVNNGDGTQNLVISTTGSGNDLYVITSTDNGDGTQNLVIEDA